MERILSTDSPQNLSHNSTLIDAQLVEDFKRFTIRDVDIVFGVMYALIVCFGVVGNCLVVAVVKRNLSMHTTTNFLLVNLAVADVVTLLLNPRTYSFTFYPSHPKGLLGDYICKVFSGNAIISTAIGASVLTLTTVAVERYHALVKPMMGKLRIEVENVKYVIGGIWLLALLINLPDFVAVRYDDRYGRCICPYSLEAVTKAKVHVLCTVVFLGCLPFVVLGFCYLQIIRGIFFQRTIIGHSQGEEDERSKRKLAKLLLSVTFAFYICYLPYGTFISFLALSDRETLVKNQDFYNVWLKLVEFLVTCSSFSNPVLYAFQSSNYRDGFLKICCLNKAVRVTDLPVSTFCNRKTNDAKETFTRLDEPNVFVDKDMSSNHASRLNSGCSSTIGTSNVSLRLEGNEGLQLSSQLKAEGNSELQCKRKSNAWVHIE